MASTALALRDAADSILDQDTMLARLEGDVELLREIAALFLEDYPERLAALHAAIAGGDAQALELAAHSLKGSLGNFAAERAVAAALRLELIGRGGNLARAGEACAELEKELARLTPLLEHLA
ncbi:MAG: Hpt domain-containing protein [Deltaproteobacteria bacterium]|nr:Hpt domain-containing protein [Deltaproteobacteria bacterium]